MARQSIKISVTADTQRFRSELGKIGQAQGGIGKLKQSFSALGIGMKGLAAGAIGFGATAAFALGKQAVGAASNLQQSMGAVDDVFKSSAKQVHAYAQKAADAVGLSRNQYNEMATLIGTQLKNGGTAANQLADQANKVIKIGADLSAQFGGNTKDAVDALSAALKGERDPIEKYGISLTQNAIDAEAAALGYKKPDSSPNLRCRCGSMNPMRSPGPLASLLRPARAALNVRRGRPALQHVTDGGVTLRWDGAPRRPQALDSVYRALAILEGSIAQLTLDRYSKTLGRPRGSATRDIQRMLGDDATLASFLAETTRSLAMTGNAWIRHSADTPGGPRIRLLDPRRCAPCWPGHRRQDHHLRRLQDDRHPAAPAHPRRRRAARRLPDPGLGRRIDRRPGRQPVRLRLDPARRRPTGILTTDQTLSADDAKRWKDAANKTMTPTGGVAVLGSGLTYKQCYLTPAELQLLDVKKVNTISVARIFGIPARLMLTSGDGDSKTYANMEQESILFVRHTLMPYMREIEQALSSILSDDVRFNVDGFLRPDTTTRYAAHKVALEAGFLTIDEVRAIEGLNPIATEKQDEKGGSDDEGQAAPVDDGDETPQRRPDDGDADRD